MSTITLLPTRIIQVKNPVLVSNLIELKEIVRYKDKHPELSMNDAAIRWINKNAAAWRAKHPMEILTRR
jgi:hypothetical protein